MSEVKRWYIGVYGGEAQARTCSPHPFEVIREVEGDTFVLSRDHNAALAREAALQQRLTAADDRADLLERDAVRYRWLRDPDNQESLEPDSDYLMPPIICGHAEHENILTMEALDKTIDAAMIEVAKQ
ncbi:hypothetical protein [Pseudomonas fluorescens]|uniref:hypothetical protein n=1 Tax=Pseudomonas fluorescens TaxID=294 RepID=UPI001BE50929|nr:hypothetical protein [Pseudomonas fluorescens]MBT2371961.1 hypothetical protein [Pseudomonas fluorescens]